MPWQVMYSSVARLMAKSKLLPIPCTSTRLAAKPKIIFISRPEMNMDRRKLVKFPPSPGLVI